MMKRATLSEVHGASAQRSWLPSAAGINTKLKQAWAGLVGESNIFSRLWCGRWLVRDGWREVSELPLLEKSSGKQVNRSSNATSFGNRPSAKSKVRPDTPVALRLERPLSCTYTTSVDHFELLRYHTDHSYPRSFSACTPFCTPPSRTTIELLSR